MLDEDDDKGPKIPLTIRDVVSMLTVVVTITLAWSVFGTRLTLLEKEVINVNIIMQDQKDRIKGNEIKIAGNEARVRDLENSVEDLWKSGSKKY